MEDILAIARIITRQPAVIATFLIVGTGLGVLGTIATRRRNWSTQRRWALVAAGFAFAVLPATTLARRLDQVQWRLPGGGEFSALSLRAPGLAPTTPEDWLNVVMLVPFGVLAVLATRRPGLVTIAAASSVVAVEVLQGAAGIGVMSVADAVHNLLGAALGAATGALITRDRLRASPVPATR